MHRFELGKQPCPFPSEQSHTFLMLSKDLSYACTCITFVQNIKVENDFLYRISSAGLLYRQINSFCRADTTNYTTRKHNPWEDRFSEFAYSWRMCIRVVIRFLTRGFGRQFVARYPNRCLAEKKYGKYPITGYFGEFGWFSFSLFFLRGVGCRCLARRYSASLL